MRVLIATLLLGIAAAGADPAAQKHSEELFAEGRKLIEAHDDAAACGKFNEAIKLDPNAAGTMLNLGLCNQNLKKYRLALYWFRKAQARAHETNLPDYEAAAGARTKDLAALVATIQIDASPADIRVKLDGEELLAADYLRVEIDEGHHTLDASSPGHRPSHQELDVTGKGGQTVSVHLEVGEDSIVVDPGAGRRKVAIVTASAGGALLITASVIALYAKSQYKCANGTHIDLTTSSYCMSLDEPTLRKRDNDARVLAEYWATSIAVAGVVAVGVAAYVYFTAPQAERINQTVFVPTLSPAGLGLAAVGHF
jgi:tetratricopeptide (TPR) repeat protein